MKNRAVNLFKLNEDNFIIEDDVLTYLKTNKKNHHNFKRIVIPEILINDIIQTYHDSKISGHLGVEKTYWKVIKDFWFPDIYGKIENYVKNCDICERNKKFFKYNDELHPIVSTQPFEIIELDHVGPFIKTPRGNQYILSVIDHFSKKRWF